MKIDTFLNAAVRDLAWVIHSPVLTQATRDDTQVHILDDAFCQRQYQQSRAWLQQLDQSPAPLHDWLAKRRSHRLGYYFEQLVEFWLRHWVNDDHVIAHVPVRKDKHTLGEFDFLFTEAGSRLVQHWEVAVKFYLAYGHPDRQVLFYGPQARDRLDLKLARMLQHQSLLSATPEGRQSIVQSGLCDTFDSVVRSVLLKGYLFYPVDHQADLPLRLDEHVSPTHLRGWWTRSDSLQIPAGSAESRWYRLPRSQWLAPAMITRDNAHLLLTQDALDTFCTGQFAQRPEPILLAEMFPGPGGMWQEINRGFVVPASWPGAVA